jgi:hypothetical protein
MQIFTRIVTILLVLTVGYGLYYWYQWDQKHGIVTGYINLKNYDSEIYSAIRNGGDLESFQSLVNILSKENYQRSRINSIESKDYFIRPRETVTEDILLGMKGLYLANGIKDSLDNKMIENIDKLIQEYRYLNPFGVLEENQQYFFENMRVKLGDNYSIIELDAIQLVKELKEKNSVVKKYLANSEKSLENSETSLGRSGIALFIAICSLLIAILVNVPAIFDKIKNLRIVNDE